MLDIGIIGRKSDDYETKFLNELIPGEEISGEIYIGEIKKTSIERSESYQFYVILTDNDDQRKWICSLVTSYYPETGNIYGEKGGRVYTFIDTLNHVINNDPLNVQDSYSVNFNTFRDAVNDNVSSVTVKAVSPLNPHAKYVNLAVISAQLTDETTRRRPSSLEDLADKNAVIRIAYANIRGKAKEITLQNVAVELKSMQDRDEITELEFKNALKELDAVKQG
ncbi:MAG: hypothetical protein A4E26_00104 [Methanobacterium sp. PtaU1.Bin097]|jgi:hypothetical protein|nr:MAG: hypothetical protein A4E26_00104 [Methanobacterium sp. PtaU1.Bin097]